MKDQKNKWRGRIINLVFFGVLLFFLVSTPAKSWLLRQLVRTGIFSANIEQVKDSTASKNVMPLSFSTPEGSTVNTAELTGKVVFINFWASWCPPCRAEMPGMQSLYETLKSDSSFAFVFINLDDQPSIGKKYLDDNGYTLPLNRAIGFIPSDFYSGSLPTTVVLNKDGAIVMKHTGMADYSARKFIGQLNALK